MGARSGRAVRRVAGTAAADGVWETPREDLPLVALIRSRQC